MNYLEIFGTFIGIIYLWLEYRASIYLWLAGIIMPAIYIFVYYDAGLYADFGINIYYLIAAIYGWFSLDVGTRGKEKSPHYTYPVEMLSATIPCVYRVFRRHRPDTYRIHRQ